LGELAEPLEVAVARAVTLTHRHSVAAQDHSGTLRRDPYGHTRKRRQFETLVQFAAGIPGCSTVHPKGAAYDLVRLVDQRLLVFPWHFAADGARPIAQARFTMSKLRAELLTGPGDPDPQLTTDDITLSTEEINSRYAEEQEVAADLRAWGGFVIVGFASNPHRLHRAGWGIGHISDAATGEVRWEEPWVEIPVEQVLKDHPLPDGALLRPVPGAGAPEPAGFAEGTPEALGLAARKPEPGEADSQ
jgi:hypothetical protein